MPDFIPSSIHLSLRHSSRFYARRLFASTAECQTPKVGLAISFCSFPLAKNGRKGRRRALCIATCIPCRWSSPSLRLLLHLLVSSSLSFSFLASTALTQLACISYFLLSSHPSISSLFPFLVPSLASPVCQPFAFSGARARRRALSAVPNKRALPRMMHCEWRVDGRRASRTELFCSRNV